MADRQSIRDSAPQQDPPSASVCRSCRKNPAPGRYRCSSCERVRTIKGQILREAGFCRCGAPPEEGKSRCLRCRERANARQRKAYDKVAEAKKRIDLKTETMRRYGGRKCACCGESTLEFLQIDHVGNDGAKHRKQIGKGCLGEKFYKWLKRNGYPEGFQVLCGNCNFAKSSYGVCPHQKAGK